MADVDRTPRIQSIEMAVFPGTERAKAFDHAITLAVAHQADVRFVIGIDSYHVQRARLHDLVLKSGVRDASAPPAPPAPPENKALVGRGA